MGKNLLQINLKSGIFSVAVYTTHFDPISDVHWLVRRNIGSAVRGWAKLVDIRMPNIENDRLVTIIFAIIGTTRPRWRLLSHWYYTSSSCMAAPLAARWRIQITESGSSCISYVVPTKLKSGGGRPLVPHRSIYAHEA